MNGTPEVRYARAPDGAHIAYQVYGEGPFDLLCVVGGWTHLEMRWEEPSVARAWRRLGSIARVITFDMRGYGLSVRTIPLPPYEQQVEDVIAVLDAAGIEDVAVVATLNGGFLAALFAARHPERVRVLVLQSTGPRLSASPDFPHGLSETEVQLLRDLADSGDLETLLRAVVPPEQAADETFMQWWSKYGRSAAGPDGLLAIFDLVAATDIRDELPKIKAPTFIVHHEQEMFFPLEGARLAAELIPNAQLRVLPGAGTSVFRIDADPWIEEVEVILTGARRTARVDRRMASVLFTDIVDSTARAVEVGDQSWRNFLERHDSLVRGFVAEYGGRLIKSTGDGALAIFDSPRDAIECATTLLGAVRALGADIRAGVHTGEVELVGDDVAGLAVHIGSRISALAGTGEVLVSQTVRDLLAGSALRFDDRGEHQLKGLPGTWRAFAVTS